MMLAVVVVMMGLVGCGTTSTQEENAVSIPAFELVVVTEEAEVVVDESMIEGLAITEAELLKTSQKGDTTSTWTGCDLMEVLSIAGVTEFTTLSVEASDGYAQEYTYDMAQKTMLAFYENGELLGEDGPLNTVIEGESGSIWMKNLTKIIVE